ncbi:hypothetical protein ACA910_007932 [Epithemia clementina (nom. ined.)]
MKLGAAFDFLSATAFLFAFATGIDDDNDDDDDCEDGPCSPRSNDTKNKPLECFTYMAPSTLGENTNMGIYTGVSLKENAVVNWPEIAVPLLFREWGQHPEDYMDGQLWDRYIWEGYLVDIETYVETNTPAFIPGVGCTVNGVMDMMNIQSTHGSTYDTAGLHRSRDPGSGAFSGYYDSITSAAQDIPAGSELLAQYGADWVPKLPGVQVTLDEPMDKADDFLVDDYIPFILKHDNNKDISDNVKEALWNFTKTFPVYSQAMTTLPRDLWSEVEQFVHESSLLAEGQLPNDLSIVRHFLRKHYIRPLEWLQTHPNSYCQDHIRPDKSTIPQAGRGAFATRDLPAGTVVGYAPFATRDLPAGTVVGYAPLIHIGKDGRKIFDIEYTNVYKKGTRHQYDLIINYSFGHPNSTMLLTPYGGMVNYINHASGSVANVQVRFPDKELIAHKPEWLHRDPEFFHNAIEKIGLSFEYVALRDIKQGEEVFMDYGPVWEQAWELHVRTWKPLQGSEQYEHSKTWAEPFFRTTDELASRPYPDNLHTMCLRSYTVNSNGEYVFVHGLETETAKRWCCNVKARRPNGENEFVYDIELRLTTRNKKNVNDDEDDDDDDDDDDDSVDNPNENMDLGQRCGS